MRAKLTLEREREREGREKRCFGDFLGADQKRPNCLVFLYSFSLSSCCSADAGYGPH